MATRKATTGAIVVIAFACLMVSALGVLVETQAVYGSRIHARIGVGVYSNSGCTTPLSAISWGTLNAGNVTTRTMYVKNTGTVSEALNMTVNNWSPSAASCYIKLAWNQEKAVLTAGQVVTAILTLSVSSNISNIASFSNSIIITGMH